MLPVENWDTGAWESGAEVGVAPSTCPVMHMESVHFLSYTFRLYDLDILGFRRGLLAGNTVRTPLKLKLNLS